MKTVKPKAKNCNNLYGKVYAFIALGLICYFGYQSVVGNFNGTDKFFILKYRNYLTLNLPVALCWSIC